MEMTEDKRSEVETAARALRRELFSDELLDQLMSRVDEGGVALTGAGGFLPELVKAVLERGMDAELTDHLGYEKGDPAGRGSGNSRKPAVTEATDTITATNRVVSHHDCSTTAMTSPTTASCTVARTAATSSSRPGPRPLSQFTTAARPASSASVT